jgi:type III pantothenate kinase
MLLAIDVGNTNTKFAVHDGTTWRAQWRASTDTTRTADEYAPWLNQIMALSGLAFTDVKACIVSTVVPQALFNLRNLSRRYLGSEPMVIGEDGLKLGIEVRIDKPNEAGADRLVNAVGAFIEYGGPAIVIDRGSISHCRRCTRQRRVCLAWRSAIRAASSARTPLAPCSPASISARST